MRKQFLTLFAFAMTAVFFSISAGAYAQTMEDDDEDDDEDVEEVSRMEWKTFESEQFKVSFDYPAKMMLTTKEKKEGWGVLEGKFDPFMLHVEARLVKVSFEDLKSYAIEEGELDAEHMELIEEETDELFEYQAYECELGEGDAAVLLVIGRHTHADISYIIALAAPHDAFETYEEDVDKWLDSFEFHE